MFQYSTPFSWREKQKRGTAEEYDNGLERSTAWKWFKGEKCIHLMKYYRCGMSSYPFIQMYWILYEIGAYDSLGFIEKPFVFYENVSKRNGSNVTIYLAQNCSFLVKITYDATVDILLQTNDSYRHKFKCTESNKKLQLKFVFYKEFINVKRQWVYSAK